MSLLSHLPQLMFQTQENTGQVGIYCQIPVLFIEFTQGYEWYGDSLGSHTGVIESEVNYAESGYGLSHHRLYLLFISYVALDKDGFRTHAFELFHGLFGFLYAMSGSNDHFGPLSGKQAGRTQSDSTGPTGDDNNLPLNSC
jgi:hypothetical protein